MNPPQRDNRPASHAARRPRPFTRTPHGARDNRTRHVETRVKQSGDMSTRPPAPRAHTPASHTGPRTENGRPERTNSTNRPPRRGGERRSFRGNRSRGRKKMTHPPLNQRPIGQVAGEMPVPPIMDEDTVRVIPVSGVEEIGRNMIIVETKDDIVVFDAGLQFVTEESEAPGVNYILPNTKYLEDRKDKIRALVITHGHLDHIGGIPFVMERIGHPPVYTQYLTSLMVLKRQDEFPHLPPLDMHVVEMYQSVMLGKLKLKFFPVTHSIPDSMGISIETKHGNIVITSDIKLTHDGEKVADIEEKVWGEIGKDKNLLLIADSTNAEREGFSMPEHIVHTNIEEIVKSATGRLIVGTFASQFERLINIIKTCERLGKKVVCEGRSIKVNIEIAQLAKMLEVQKGTIIPVQEMENYPADRIVILSTGAQGEEFAALMRIATDKHKFIKLSERDTIVFSSSVVPGNEIAVQKLKDNIYRRNAKVIHYRSAHVHSTGHGNVGELLWIQHKVRPTFLLPVHGHHSMLKCHAIASAEAGFPKQNIVVPDNGSVIDIIKGEKIIVQKEKAPSEMIMVDGFTVGTQQEVVIRDRQSLANDGMFVVIATVNVKTGKLRKSPDIISRGFVYLRESQQLLSEARILIKRTVEKQTENMNPLNLEFVKDELTETLSSFLMQKTNKAPMVIPVLIGI